MTSQTDGSGARDGFEDRLAGRVRGLSRRAVRPIDAAAIARASVQASGHAERNSFGRVAWALLGAGLLVVVALGGSFVASGGLDGLLAGATPIPSSASGPTPTPVPGTVAQCAVGDLAASVTGWSGAAGSRIAEVTVRNMGDGACQLVSVGGVELIDGHHHALIVAAPPSTAPWVDLPAGATATTEVQVANYCGADPMAPVSVAFSLSNGDLLVAEAVSSSDLSGVPPCNGPGNPGEISMQAWTPGG